MSWTFDYITASGGLTIYWWRQPWEFGTYVKGVMLPEHQALAIAAIWRHEARGRG